jgi:hypothetical protein
LARVFYSRPPQRTWLNYEEFKSECLFGITIRNIEAFSKSAINLLLVDVPDIERCQLWFTEYGLILNLSKELEKMNLVNLLRFMWKCDLLDQTIRRDCTLDAASRLEKKLAKILSVALRQEHPNDEWIEKNLKRYRENAVNIEGAKIEPVENLQLKLWYIPGKVAGCRLCRYRLPQKSIVSKIIQSMCYQIIPYARCCAVCKNHVISLMPFECPTAELLNDNMPRSTIIDNGIGITVSDLVEPSETV